MSETETANVPPVVPAEAKRHDSRGVRPWMGCLTGVLLGLACLCLSRAMLWLGLRGDLMFTLAGGTEIRMWLARDGRRPSLALSASSAGAASLSAACRQTRVRFLPHRPGPVPAPASYCTCTTPEGDSSTHFGACQP
jgi:hypothetical protein